MNWGKLVDDLSLAQFNSLVKVLSFQSVERDFRHLLMLSNLQEVFDFKEEFIPLIVSHLNFEGSGGSRVKE